MNRASILVALIRIARAIGRWVLRMAAKHGGSALLGYMVGKVDDFRRRLDRSKADRRREWLRGRIARWTAAIRWLRANGSRLADNVIKAADDAAAKASLPMVAEAERDRG